MASYSYQDFHDAILTNCVTVALSCVRQGLDVNANLAPFLTHFDRAIKVTNEAEGGTSTTSMKDDCLVVSNKKGNEFISALHLAIVNCYFHPNEDSHHAWTLVQRLVKCGASLTCKSKGIILCHHGCWIHHPLKDGSTPLQLAMYLKRNLLSTCPNEQQRMLDLVIETLSSAIRTSTTTSPLHESTCQVSPSTANMWSKLLFSPDFSDVTFECSDSTSLHAHKAVLAASSDYFRTCFLGPWTESHPNGIWKTANDSDTMQAVLTFIYTGTIPSVVDIAPSDLLFIAQEYHLVELTQVAESRCIVSLSTENIKSMLELADLYDTPLLSKACFEYVKSNAALVLTDPDFVTLASDKPDLWTKLSNAITPVWNKKRKREDDV